MTGWYCPQLPLSAVTVIVHLRKTLVLQQSVIIKHPLTEAHLKLSFYFIPDNGSCCLRLVRCYQTVSAAFESPPGSRRCSWKCLAVCHAFVPRFLSGFTRRRAWLLRAAFPPAYDFVSLPLSPICGLFSSASRSSSASQYALVYKGFSLLQDDLLYWQLPARFTGDKVTENFGVTSGSQKIQHLQYLPASPTARQHSSSLPSSLSHVHTLTPYSLSSLSQSFLPVSS